LLFQTRRGILPSAGFPTNQCSSQDRLWAGGVTRSENTFV
jgi:hypothetical protein